VDARIIHTKFWRDDFIFELDPMGKLLFIYLITNPAVNLMGCYELPSKFISLDTGLSSEEVARYKQQIEESGKIRFYKSWIYLVNSHRYHKFTGEKNDIARSRQYERFPKDVQEWYASVGGPEVTDTKPKTNGHLPSLVLDDDIPPIRLKSEFLSDMPTEEVEALCEMTGRSPEAVKFQAGKALAYLQSKGQKPANYQAYLVTWLMSPYNQQNGPTREVKDVTLR
jgi:hypothetical protein